MSISGATRVYGVVGHPVTHSLSPAIHNAWFAEHGIDALYAAFSVQPERAADVVLSLRTLGLAGANLTVPFKQVVIGGLDEVVGLAGVLGAVNTVVATDGRLVGHNTDAVGFVAGLEAEFGDRVSGRRVVVLGAGGAGLAVGAGLAQAGAAEVTWLNRSAPRAEAAVRTCAPAFPDTRFVAGPLDAMGFRAAAHASVIVQATSGPGAQAVARFDPDVVPQDAVWCDLNYWMDAPPLFAALRARGVAVQDGLPMLVHQAAWAFRHFTGISPDAARTVARFR